MKKVIKYTKNSILQLSSDKLFNAIIFGLFGYVIFLAILLILKSIESVMGASTFSPGISETLFYSGTGFILFFIIKMLEGIKRTGDHSF